MHIGVKINSDKKYDYRERERKKKKTSCEYRTCLISYRCLGVGPLPSRLPSSPSHMGIEME